MSFIWKYTLLASAMLATPACAATLMVGPGQTYSLPSQAIAAANTGDTIQIAAGNYMDCANINTSGLTIIGASVAGNDATVIGNKTCSTKGVFVVGGTNETISNLTLTGANVSQGNGGNGAGIRAEGVNLTINDVHLTNNQNGMLADPVSNSTILLENSQVDNNGACGPSGTNCEHGVYVDQVSKFTVQNSVFTNQRVGHDIKSRAAVTNVLNCSITDGSTGTASYLIDAPNGGKLTVQNNTMEKGANAGNPIAINYGEEGVTWTYNVLHVGYNGGNSFRNDTGSTATFVNNASKITSVVTGNTFTGSPTTPLVGP